LTGGLKAVRALSQGVQDADGFSAFMSTGAKVGQKGSK
jgi:hypothetical protein